MIKNKQLSKKLAKKQKIQKNFKKLRRLNTF